MYIDEYFVISSYTSPEGYLMILDVQPGVPYIIVNETDKLKHCFDQEDEVLFPRGVTVNLKKMTQYKSEENGMYNKYKINLLYCTITKN